LYNTFSFALRKSACQKTTAAAAAAEEEKTCINAEQQQAGHVETTMTTSANKMTIHLVAKPLHSQKQAKKGAAPATTQPKRGSNAPSNLLSGEAH